MKKIIKIIKELPKNICLMFLYFYRGCISPLFPGSCRFRPTCSEYSLECIKKFGARKGIILTAKRLSKCHPFGKKGWDPVPDNYISKKK